jgi:hypothetical protein
MKIALGHDNAHREGAARQPLAIPAMARVDELREFGDLIANFTALATAGLRELHVIPPPHGVLNVVAAKFGSDPLAEQVS